jgi:hypothetical protein
MKYYDLFQLYKKAETSVSQLQLEWDDYFDKARIEYNVAKRLSDAKGALEKAKTAMNSADKTMEEKCSK